MFFSPVSDPGITRARFDAPFPVMIDTILRLSVSQSARKRRARDDCFKASLAAFRASPPQEAASEVLMTKMYSDEGGGKVPLRVLRDLRYARRLSSSFFSGRHRGYIVWIHRGLRICERSFFPQNGLIVPEETRAARRVRVLRELSASPPWRHRELSVRSKKDSEKSEIRNDGTDPYKSRVPASRQPAFPRFAGRGRKG